MYSLITNNKFSYMFWPIQATLWENLDTKEYIYYIKCHIR